MSNFVFDDSDDLPPPAVTLPPREPIKETQPVIVPTGYRSAVVDSRFTDIAGLVPYISGSSWRAIWFSQVKGSSDELTPYNGAMHPVYQQYIRIHDLDIRVDSALMPQQNPATNEFDVTGTATITPHVIPNVGDAFIADIGDGREGIFLVTRTVRLTTLLQTAHTVDYKLTGFVADIPNLRTDMERKVVKNLWFRKDFLRYGQYPFLVEDGVVSLKHLKEMERYLITSFVQDFYHQEYGSLVTPRNVATYDHYLTRFFMDLFDIVQYPIIRPIRPKNIGRDNNSSRITLLDVIIDPDRESLNAVTEKMWTVSTRAFSFWAEQGSIYHSNYAEVVFPFGVSPDSATGTWCGCGSQQGVSLPPDDTLVQTYPYYTVVDGKIVKEQVTRGVNDPIDPTDPNAVMVPIHAVDIDSYYIFSEYFYTNADKGQSLLEWMVNNVLEGKAYDPRALIELCKGVKSWGALERFYYVPIILMLIRYASRGFNHDGQSN